MHTGWHWLESTSSEDSLTFDSMLILLVTSDMKFTNTLGYGMWHMNSSLKHYIAFCQMLPMAKINKVQDHFLTISKVLMCFECLPGNIYWLHQNQKMWTTNRRNSMIYWHVWHNITSNITLCPYFISIFLNSTSLSIALWNTCICLGQKHLYNMLFLPSIVSYNFYFDPSSVVLLENIGSSSWGCICFF